MDNMDLTVHCPRKVTKLNHSLNLYYVKPYNMNGVIFMGPTKLTFYLFFLCWFISLFMSCTFLWWFIFSLHKDNKIGLGDLGQHCFNGLVQDCSFSSVLTMEILQSCTKPLVVVLACWHMAPSHIGIWTDADLSVGWPIENKTETSIKIHQFPSIWNSRA